MSGPVSESPLSQSGPHRRPPSTMAWVRDRFERIERDLRRVAANRTPVPLLLHRLANAGNLSQAQVGHVPTYSETLGAYHPSPNPAEMLFHLLGAVIAETSPVYRARYPCAIIALQADVSFVADLNWQVLVNGVTIYTVAQTSADTGVIDVTPHKLAAGDAVTIEVTSPGDGNNDLVVHVQLGTLVGLVAGP